MMLSLTAIADPVDRGAGDATDASVIVLRGSQSRVPTAREENGVIVMRPADGSFMRETTRLAVEAEARSERAAREAARETTSRLVAALRAVESAAGAVERRQHKNHFVIFAPTVSRRVSDHGTGMSRPPTIVPPP
jgi:hypothetical protein